MATELAVINESELSLIEENVLNKNQVQHLLKKTPKAYIRQRPAKGGGTWDYVTGGYVRKVLNLMFGFDWDFEIVSEQLYIDAKQVVVKGRLTARVKDRTIVKMQFGCKDVMFKNEWIDGKKTQSKEPLNLGNDFKAATTDALKKCAAEIGVAADIYNKEEFKEVKVVSTDEQYDLLCRLFIEKGDNLAPEQSIHIDQIIKEKEERSYSKAIKILNK